MTVLITCQKCGWIGSTCYMGMQFDRNNLCPKCQPPKVVRIKSKKVDWEKERKDDEVG